MRLPAIVAPRLRYAAGGLVVLLVLVAGGWAVQAGYTGRLFLLGGIATMVTLAVFQRGVFIGLMTIFAMNGLPFIDLSNKVAGRATGQDLAALGLIAAGFIWTMNGGGFRGSPGVARFASYCGLALLSWFFFTVARTAVAGNASMLSATQFGRDFMYFGALLVVLPHVRLRPRDIELLVIVLGVGVCLFSVGQIVTAVGFAQPTWLVHTRATGQTLGLTRVYASMNDLLFAGAAVGLAAIVLARGAVARIAAPITLLLVTSLIVQLTRARWIGLIVSVLVVSAWLATRGDRHLVVLLRRRLAVLVGALVSGVVVAIVAAPGVFASGPLVQRFLSIFSDLQATSGTLAARQQVIDSLSALVGGKWVFGLGLIPPSARYFSELPQGSLRDPDVGVWNSLATIGGVGTALIYVPLIGVLIYCMRHRSVGDSGPYQWLAFGGAIFIVATIISSITLITLFSVAGLVLSAVVVAILCQPSVSGGTEVASELAVDGGRGVGGRVPFRRVGAGFDSG